MPYQYASERQDYTDLSSGRVFYSLPGHPAFPVRLASEIFQRSLAAWKAGGGAGRCVLYDPCCGAGYQLSVLATLHRESLRAAIGSDVDERAVTLAERNLSLLSRAGLEQRVSELEGLLQQFGKTSHREALESARRLLARTSEAEPGQPLAARAFRADALDAAALAQGLRGQKADLVVTDVPYGQHSNWEGLAEANRPIETLLAALRTVLAPGGVVALSSDKGQKYAWTGYRRADHFQVGKRRITILQVEEAWHTTSS
jgi:23S rRNA (guanine2535-N1)-methyltransferase